MNGLRQLDSLGAKRAGWVALAAVTIALPFMLSSFYTFQLTIVLAFSVCILGIDTTTGATGIINIASGAFFGIGAYTVIIASSRSGAAAYWAIGLAAVIAAVVGLLIAIPIARLTGWNAALLTIGLAVAFPPLVQRYTSLTGGAQGISMPRPVSPFDSLDNDQWLYLLAAVIATICLALRRHLSARMAGLTMTATRDNEVAARALGINSRYVKIVSFGLGSMLAGIGGSIYGFVTQIADPQSFTILIAITFLLGFVVGGSRWSIGPLIGGLFVEYARVLSEHVFQRGINLIYGLFLILILYVAPRGLPDIPARVRQLYRMLQARRHNSANHKLDDARDPAMSQSL